MAPHSHHTIIQNNKNKNKNKQQQNKNRKRKILVYDILPGANLPNSI